ISHLSDAERMFAVSLLLNEIIGWMRAQPGTSTLRAMLYVDEVAGYLPPVANPPTKKLFLTLLKQARAFGLSTVLATQNPVDLDYKALSNAGTWLVGRLQTEQDKARLLDGLRTLSGAGPADVGALSRTISGLGKRQFLLHSVHASEPVVFGTRWVMSYLAGPMTREHIQRVQAGRQAGIGVAPSTHDQAASPSASAASAAPTSSGTAGGSTLASVSSTRPVLSPDILQRFLGAVGEAHYRPVLFGQARVVLSDGRRGLHEERVLHIELEDPAAQSDPGWQDAALLDASEVTLQTEPVASATFAPVPTSLQEPSNYKTWARSLENWIEGSQTLELWRSERHGLTSTPGESEGSFRVRVREAAREARDRAIEAVQKKYASKIRTLEDRLQRAGHALDRESQQADQVKLNTTIAVGQTLLGVLFGGRRS